MKQLIRMKKYFVLVAFLLIQLTGNLYAVEKLKLTEQQTLGLTNCSLFDIFNAYYGADKNALPMVRNFIQSGMEINVESTAKLLGMIGTKDDLSFIEKGILSNNARYYTNFWIAVGLMARRNIKEAEELIEKALTTQYWDEYKLYKYPDEMLKDRPELKYDNFYDVFIAYLISGKDKPEERKAKLLASIANEAIKKRLSETLNSKSMQEFTNLIASGKRLIPPNISSGRPKDSVLLEILNNTGHRQLNKYSQVTNISSSDLPVSKQENQSVKENNNPTDQLNKKPLNNAADKEKLLQIIQEALSEYKKINAVFKAKDFKLLGDKIANNGIPINQTNAKLNKMKSGGYLSDIEMTIKVLDAIEKQQSIMGKAIIKIKQNEEKIANESGFDVAQKVDEVIVSIPLLKTSDIAKTFKMRNPPRNDIPTTLDENGDIMINMIKYNNKWYWNPIGW